MATAVKERSILVVHDDGSESIIEHIPGNAKITVGPLSPGRDNYRYNDIALRIYTTTSNQLAVIRNVQSFRDLSLGVQVKEVVVNEELHSESGPNGSTRRSERATQSRFVPVQAPERAF